MSNQYAPEAISCTHTSGGLLLEIETNTLSQERSALSFGGLSQEEQKLCDLLDTLPNYLLEKERTPSWKFHLNGLMVGFSFLMGLMGVPLLVAFLFPHFSTLSLVLIGLPLSLGVVFGGVFLAHKREKKIKIARTNKDVVNLRNHFIQKAIIHTQHPLLQGRLAELLHLVKNPNIDYRFWVNLDNRLKPYIKNQTNRLMSSDTLDQIRAQYRHRVSYAP